MNNPGKPQRLHTHGQFLEILLERHRDSLPRTPVFVETGCGISTLRLADVGRRLGATVYSCDFNANKVTELRRRAGTRVDNIEFILGDSVESLKLLAARHPQFNFLFLDAAASAMHTFREFQAAETALVAGSVLLIDNAALPGETSLLSPCRKGKVIVPYLQASAWWEVHGHPLEGDSMISAVRHGTPDYADRDYEWPEYVDPWEWSFNNEWE